jgi:hypothetical protein
MTKSQWVTARKPHLDGSWRRPLYRAAVLQYRKLKALLRRLEKLSQTILRQQAKLAHSQHSRLTAKTGGYSDIPALNHRHRQIEGS